MLPIHSEECDYWDNSGTSGLKYLFEAGKALVTGWRPNVPGDTKIHGKLNLYVGAKKKKGEGV